MLKIWNRWINIDESRVDYISRQKHQDDIQKGQLNADNGKFLVVVVRVFPADLLGRFPANLIHDNSEEVTDCFLTTRAGTTRERRRIQS